MLSIVCGRPHPPSKPWILSSLHHHHVHLCPPSSPTHHHHAATDHRSFFVATTSAAASVWHTANSGSDVAAGGMVEDWRRDYLMPGILNHNHHHHDEKKGEGSWNVAWDARPARWIHRVDVAWLLLGVCACLAPSIDWTELNAAATTDTAAETAAGKAERQDSSFENRRNDGAGNDHGSHSYKVTGVPADGRCLFRAIVHGACLQSGQEAPDENQQRELSDELRAKVVEELLKRRDEIEWFIEGDFDTYIKRIEQPYVWGGEPELLMAAHVLKSRISVYMKDKISDTLTKIADYGEEYRKEKDIPINVLFHGYGHYDILETSSN